MTRQRPGLAGSKGDIMARDLTNDDLIQELDTSLMRDALIPYDEAVEAVALLRALQARAPELIEAIDRGSGEVSLPAPRESVFD